MSQANAENSTSAPITRRAVEQQIDALINLLDHLDPDPDLEPSLGFTDPQAWYGETQDGPSYAGNANAGDDREADDEREPPVDDEPSLGWLQGIGYTNEQLNQDGHEHFWANHDAGSGLEEDQSDDEPDSDGERNLGWSNEGAQLGEWFADHQEQESTSPEWPAPHPTTPLPTRRRVAPPVPTIPMSVCTRVTL